MHLFVYYRKNCLKWIQCFHNTSILCTLLFVYLLPRNSLHGQQRSSQNNVCCTRKVKGNSDRSRFLCQHQATDFPSIRTTSPQVTSHNQTAWDKITQGSPSDIPVGSTGWGENFRYRKTNGTCGIWALSCPQQRSGSATFPSPWVLSPHLPLFRYSYKAPDRCSNASIRSSLANVFGYQVLAEYKETLFPLPLSFYWTYCLLRTSKIRTFRKLFSDKKILQGECLLFIYLQHMLYTGNLFLTRNFVCCTPFIKTAR